MAKLGKRMRALREKIQRRRLYDFQEACKLVAESATAKFDETIEMAIRLGVDPRKADQNVRGSVSLPHGLGKEIRVAVFAKGDKAQEAKDAGADVVGSDDLLEQVKAGNLNFDTVIATPDMMSQVGKVGKILGPRGLMPSPKVGTVTFEVGNAVREAKAGKVEYRVDKAGIVHAPVGKASFGAAKISENAQALVHALNRAKPSTSKGVYLKGAVLPTTMGPGVHFDTTALRTA